MNNRERLIALRDAGFIDFTQCDNGDYTAALRIDRLNVCGDL
jgi:hypothetical protein